MAIIKFVNEKKEIQVPDGSNLRSEALRAGVALYPGHQQNRSTATASVPAEAAAS